MVGKLYCELWGNFNIFLYENITVRNIFTQNLLIDSSYFAIFLMSTSLSLLLKLFVPFFSFLFHGPCGFIINVFIIYLTPVKWRKKWSFIVRRLNSNITPENLNRRPDFRVRFQARKRHRSFAFLVLVFCSTFYFFYGRLHSEISLSLSLSYPAFRFFCALFSPFFSVHFPLKRFFTNWNTHVRLIDIWTYFLDYFSDFFFFFFFFWWGVSLLK